MIISLGLGANYLQPDIHSFPRNQGNSVAFNIPEDNTLRLVGIMAEFKEEEVDNPLTSGRGRFLSGPVEDYNHYYTNITSPRCDGFLVDKPPHDSLYFYKQLKAVGNYYSNVSNNNLAYTSTIIKDKYYQVSKEMEYYATGDVRLVEFFTEALDSAKEDIESYFGPTFNPDSLVFIVFHAGLSQDISYPTLDPTIYDLKSAYIDSTMMKNAITQGVIPSKIKDVSIYTGIILPETNNHIYYDVIEDIYGDENLCAYQLGITGIFAFNLGYALGLPPMFNNDPSSIYFGDPGVGYFGLMDYGSNNGRGVIPAPPTPWTRIKAGWSEVVNIDSEQSIIIEPYDIDNKIYKIDISEDEYFLIENRNNWVLPSVDIDSLRSKHKINENQLGYWFDVVTDLEGEFIENDLIKIDSGTNVITAFDHYDYGLPGSGILIWHIKEPDESIYWSGINNDRDNRHVEIEEADGAVNIGFENYSPFGLWDQTKGTQADMWYAGNAFYLLEGNPHADEVIFDNQSNPNTRTTAGSESFLSIKILTGIADAMQIRINMDDGIDITYLSDEPVDYLGNSVENDIGYIFYGRGNNIYRHSRLGGAVSIGTYNAEEDKFIFTYYSTSYDTVYITDNQYAWIDTLDDGKPQPHETHKAPMGYIYEHDKADTVTSNITTADSYSFGDIDLDGLDEIVITYDGGLSAINSNGILVNGFPVKGNFLGIPLIANIIDDNKPEIICREGDDIAILSNRGEKIRQLSSLDADQPLSMVPFWNADTVALIDGSRLFLFKMDRDHNYWLNARSQPSGLPLSTGKHNSLSQWKQKAYNYPNPITEGHTTFRFFIEEGGNPGNVQIRIYDAAGFLVKDDLELKNSDVIENEFNEVPWININVDAGFYLAEIKRNFGKSELVRLVVIK